VTYRPWIEVLETRAQPGAVLPWNLEAPDLELDLFQPDGMSRSVGRRHLDATDLIRYQPAGRMEPGSVTAVFPASAPSAQPQPIAGTPPPSSDGSAAASDLAAVSRISRSADSIGSALANGLAAVTTAALLVSQHAPAASLRRLPPTLTPGRFTTVTHEAGSTGVPPPAGGDISYAPFFNSAGPNESHAVAARSDGTAYTTGWTMDARGRQELYVERTSPAGIANGIALIGAHGSSLSGNGITISGTGDTATVDVIGTLVNRDGSSAVVLATLPADLSVVSNAVIVSTTDQSDLSGSAIGLDGQGNVLLTGQIASPEGGQDILVAKVAPDFQSGILGGVRFEDGDAAGRALAFAGDGFGNIFLGGTLQTSPTDTAGVYLSVRGDFQAINWADEVNNRFAGPGGAVNGLKPLGDYLYLTGAIQNKGRCGGRGLLLGRVDQGDGNPDYLWLYIQRHGDLIGRSIDVDQTESALVLGDTSASTGGTCSTRAILNEFAPGGGRIVGSSTLGSDSAPSNTHGLGVALQEPTPGATVFLAGWTEDVLPTTANAARPQLDSEGHDGWMAAVSPPF
jgi:hypothetical protein